MFEDSQKDPRAKNIKGKYIAYMTGTYPSAIYSNESIKRLSVLHSGLKREWQPILTPPKIQSSNSFLKAF